MLKKVTTESNLITDFTKCEEEVSASLKSATELLENFDQKAATAIGLQILNQQIGTHKTTLARYKSFQYQTKKPWDHITVVNIKTNIGKYEKKVHALILKLGLITNSENIHVPVRRNASNAVEQQSVPRHSSSGHNVSFVPEQRINAQFLPEHDNSNRPPAPPPPSNSNNFSAEDEDDEWFKIEPTPINNLT